MQGANLFYNVGPIVEYFTAEKPLSKNNSPRCIEEWCEESNPLLDLSIDDRVPLESDHEESINLISGILPFLKWECRYSKLNFSLLNTRPLNYEICKLAQWHIKQFYAFFKIEDPQDLSSTRYNSAYGLDPAIQYIIPKGSLKALMRYTKRLKFDEKNAALVQAQVLEKQRLINPGLRKFSIQHSRGEMPKTKEKQCFDECVLF